MAKQQVDSGRQKDCFVMMPISDIDGYIPGHFNLVFEHLIVPACREAGFEPIRADQIKQTNHIVIDIIKRIIESDIAVCDISAKNPNVLYELGFRQAFNKPVVLIKDERTESIFDIHGFRYVEYNSDLRIDNAKTSIEKLAECIRETYKAKDTDINSITQLLSIENATLKPSKDIPQETLIILNAINSLGERLEAVERLREAHASMNRKLIDRYTKQKPIYPKFHFLKMILNGEFDSLLKKEFYIENRCIGELVAVDKEQQTVTFKQKNGAKITFSFKDESLAALDSTPI
jgi:hypothetical protein